MESILTHAAVCRKVVEVYNEHHCTRLPPNHGLQGLCGLASHLLFDTLRHAGYDARFVLAMNEDYVMGSHAWVAVGDLNIDITATQFQSCSPVFNFQGDPKEHPILKNFTKYSHHFPIRWFPEGWRVAMMKSGKKINEVLSRWPREERYYGATKKRVNDILFLLTLTAI